MKGYWSLTSFDSKIKLFLILQQEVTSLFFSATHCTCFSLQQPPTSHRLHDCMLILSISKKKKRFFKLHCAVLYLGLVRHWFSQIHYNAYSQLFSGLFFLSLLFKSKIKPRTTLIASINISTFQHCEYSFSLSFSKVNQAHFQCKNVQIWQDHVNICTN